MRQKSGPEEQPAEDAIRDIRRATRRHISINRRPARIGVRARGGENLQSLHQPSPFALPAVRRVLPNVQTAIVIAVPAALATSATPLHFFAKLAAVADRLASLVGPSLP